MNLETDQSFNPSSLVTNFAAPSADTPVYFYNNGSHEMMQQQHQQQQQQHVLPDQPQQQQHHHQLQQQMSYPGSMGSPLFRFGQNSLRGISSPALARALSTLSVDKSRRPRGEKKPIPDEQKDDKYFERRRRNNEAAKKSRDARKAREDELAMRASFLEKDNSILKVQVRSMRDEAMNLRELWVAKCQGMAMSRQIHQNQQQVQNSLQIPAQGQAQNPVGQQGRSS